MCIGKIQFTLQRYLNQLFSKYFSTEIVFLIKDNFLINFEQNKITKWIVTTFHQLMYI